VIAERSNACRNGQAASSVVLKIKKNGAVKFGREKVLSILFMMLPIYIVLFFD